MRIMITGGSGYIGSNLTKFLLKKKYEIVSFDIENLNFKKIKNFNQPSLKKISGDIRDFDLLSNSLEFIDSIAHLAAIPGLIRCDENPKEAISVNIYGTHQVLEAAKKKGVKRIVFSSSAAVYGSPRILPVTEKHKLSPLNLYGVTKFSSEKLMEVYSNNCDIETVILRFGNVYGVGIYSHWDTVIPKFVKLGLEGMPLTVYGDGSSSRDFVHVDDVCQALQLALIKEDVDGEIFNIGNEPTSIGEIARIVAEEVELVTNKKVEIQYIKPRPGETREFSYDLSKIKSKLGYKPKWKLRDGIKQLIKYRLDINNKQY